MPFSGIPGSVYSYPGNIVPGLVSAFGYAPFNYIVHVTSSQTVRVKFDKQVVSSEAFKPENYKLSAVTLGSIVPVIVSIRAYEDDLQQFELVLENRLKTGSIYSLEIYGVPALDGIGGAVSSAHNFPATVFDPAIATKSILYTESNLLVLFDRPVKPYSTSPIATLSNRADPSEYVVLSYVSTSEPVPDEGLVFNIPTVSFSADEWDVGFTDVYDISNNVSAGSVPVIIPEEIPRPLTNSGTSNISLLKSFITNYSKDYFDSSKTYANIRLIFNTPVDSASASNQSNYTVTSNGVPKTFVTITSVDSNSYCDVSYGSSTYFCPENEYGWHVDIRVESDGFESEYDISCTIDSEDTLSTTPSTPFHVSNVMAEPLVLGQKVSPDSYIRLDLNKEISIPYGTASVEYNEEVRFPASSPFSSLSEIGWALYNAWVSYDNHRLNQSHSTLDTENVLDSSYLPTASTNSLIFSANKLLDLYLAHRSSAVYHGGTFTDRNAGVADYSPFTYQHATDEESLIRLVTSISRSLDEHTLNQFLHLGSSQKWRTAPLNTSCFLRTGSMQNAVFAPCSITGSVISYNGDLTETADADFRSAPVVWITSPLPYPAAVIPISALREEPSGLRFNTDQIELYLSKKMIESEITGLTVVPSTMSINDSRWVSNTKIVSNVSSMGTISYSLTVTDLKDLGGNSVP